MTPGDQLSFVIDDLDDQGDGVGRAAALEIHVAGTLPGEEITARVDNISSHRPVAWATLRTIHRPSPQRVQAACPAQGRCGGCVMQHCAVTAQVAWKDAWLRRRVAAHAALATTTVAPVVPSPLSLGYRNNSKLVAGRTEPTGPTGELRLTLGAYARRSHQVVDLAGCRVTEATLEPVAASLRDVLNAHGVVPYDEVHFTGELRYAVLRASAAGAVLLTLVTASGRFPAGAAVARELCARHPEVAGVIQNVNPTRGNTIYGALERPLAGVSAIEDQIAGVRLRLSSRAFFQANRHVAQAAYAAILKAARLTGTERVVDAYAGVGGIALTLAPHAHTVFGIEEHPGAVIDAQSSALLNGITNATFAAGDVADYLGALGGAEVVVLNPPRKGCADRVLRQVVALRPRTVAYLSCAPETLLRDLTRLAVLNYRVIELQGFDMLPHTPHLEVLAILGPAAR